MVPSINIQNMSGVQQLFKTKVHVIPPKSCPSSKSAPAVDFFTIY